MKIANINNNIVYNRLQKTKNNNTTKSIASSDNFDKLDIKKSDKVPFTGRDEALLKLLKLEAKGLLNESNRIFLEFRDLKDNSYFVLANSADIKEFADEVLEKSSIVLDDAKRKFNHGKLRKFKPILGDGDEIARDYYLLGDKFVIEDYKDSSLDAKTIYDKNSISVFIRNLQTGKFDTWVFDREDGSLVQYGRDVRINEVKGKYSAKEQLIFVDNELYTCDTDYTCLAGVREYSSQNFEFSNGELSRYFLGKNVDYANGTVKAGEHYVYDGPILANAYKNYFSSNAGNMKFGEFYGFDENGDSVSCLVGLNRQADGKSTTKKAFYFNENGLNHVRVNISGKEDSDGTVTTFSSRMYTFDDVVPMECFVGASQKTNSDVRCERAIKLN